MVTKILLNFLNALAWIFFFNSLAFAQSEVIPSGLPEDHLKPESMWAETPLYLEFVTGPKENIAKRKINIFSQKNVNELTFFDNPELKGTPSLFLNKNGLHYKNKTICTWHEGIYSGKSYKGKGANLRFCPKDSPLFTYEVAEEKEERINIQLVVLLNKHIKDNVFESAFGTQKLYIKLPNPKLWQFHDSLANLNNKFSTNLFKNQEFTLFLNNLKNCVHSKKTGCLRSFLPVTATDNTFTRSYQLKGKKVYSDGALSVVDQNAPDLIVECPVTGKKLVPYLLSEEEFENCIFKNPNLYHELRTCIESRGHPYVEYFELAPDIEEKFLVKLQGLKSDQSFIKVSLLGDLYKCNFFKFMGHWILGEFVPHMKKIKELQASGQIKIITPAAWPFQSTSL